MEILTTAQVAAILKLSPRRVRELAHMGELPALASGRDWVFLRNDVEAFKGRERRGRGRPKKDGTPPAKPKKPKRGK